MTTVRDVIPDFAKKALRRLLGPKSAERKFYEGKEFLDGYIAHTNHRVEVDPKDAIGGMWEEIGLLQFEFLKKMGLRPEHHLLDIGCGTLRGGRHFIGYLNAGNYTGIDISPACLDAARDLLEAEQLKDKNPKLVLNTSKDMKFTEFEGETFDFILAQSVFTHLPESIIRECLGNVGRCMHENSAFYFTYYQAKSETRLGLKDFAYPWSVLEALAVAGGLRATEVSDSYPHPRDQKMGCVMLDGSSSA